MINFLFNSKLGLFIITMATLAVFFLILTYFFPTLPFWWMLAGGFVFPTINMFVSKGPKNWY